VGEWKFKLSPDESTSLFSTVASLEQVSKNDTDIVLDGTSVALKHYVAGKLTFSYGSNGPAKEQLSRAVLNLLSHHVPAKDLPRSDDWRYKLPGTKI
jgi:hypothetical protein